MLRKWLVCLMALCLAGIAACAETAPAPVYRALVVGEREYAVADVADRDGAIHTAEGMRDMLLSLSMDYSVLLKSDIGAEELLEAISAVYDGAQPQDVSLFYINCHGYHENGITWLLFSDGSTLTAPDLERALRRVPGTVVVIIDACNSGGFIGRSELDFSEGFVHAFSGASVASGLRSSKYKVICSSGLEQQSYRLGFTGAAEGSESIATVLARCLSEGAGWDLIGDKRSAMRADVDFDGTVTLSDMAEFLDQRIGWYLDQTGGTYEQNIQVYPEGDGFVLFRREN